MCIWLPGRVYRYFPLFVGIVGVVGCLGGSLASLALGGMLMIYSSGVYWLRKG
jgi:hypothetical protein